MCGINLLIHSKLFSDATMPWLQNNVIQFEVRVYDITTSSIWRYRDTDLDKKVNTYDFSFQHGDVIKWKQFLHYWHFVRGIHLSPVGSPHKGQWRGALMFCLICAWINGWVNNREAGDLRRHRSHYDVTVMGILPERIAIKSHQWCIAWLMEWFDLGYKQRLSINTQYGLFQQMRFIGTPQANQLEATQASLLYRDSIIYKS